MGTIYTLKELTKLEFQLDSQNVLMHMEIIHNQGKEDYEYLISHSELNKIMGRIQSDNAETDLHELLKVYQLSEEQVLYSVDLEQVKLNHDWANYYEFGGQYKEIRA